MVEGLSNPSDSGGCLWKLLLTGKEPSVVGREDMKPTVTSVPLVNENPKIRAESKQVSIMVVLRV